MSKVVDYITVFGNFGEINQNVIMHMDSGWQPLGGICVGENNLYCQTMVKYDTSVEDEIHYALVVDFPNFVQEWRDLQSYPRSVKEVT